MELVTILLISIVMLSLNFSGVIISALHIPYGAVFIPITHWYEDYFFYLSQVTLGAMGKWFSEDLYTSIPVHLGLTWWHNVALGKLLYVIPVYPWVLYTGALFLMLALYLALVYVTMKVLFPKSSISRIAGFLFCLAGTGFFTVTHAAQGYVFNTYQFFFTNTLALNRLGGIYQQALFVVLLLLYILGISAYVYKPIPVRSYRFWTMAAVYALVTVSMVINNVLTASVSMFIILIGAAISWWKMRKWKLLSSLILFLLLTHVCSLIPFMIQWETFQDPIMKGSIIYESSMPKATPLLLFQSTGILSIFVIFGLIPFLRKATPLRIIGSMIAIVPALIYLSPVPGMLGFQANRLLQPVSYVFLGAIGAEGILWISKGIARVSKFIPFSLPYILSIVLFLGVSAPSLYVETLGHISSAASVPFLTYIDPSVIEAFTYLRNNPHGRTLSILPWSLLAPVVTGAPTIGAYRGDSNYAQQSREASAFFSFRMTTDFARSWIRNDKIGSVFSMGNQQYQNRMKTMYPFLIPVWTSSNVVIYIIGD